MYLVVFFHLWVRISILILLYTETWPTLTVLLLICILQRYTSGIISVMMRWWIKNVQTVMNPNSLHWLNLSHLHYCKLLFVFHNLHSSHSQSPLSFIPAISLPCSRLALRMVPFLLLLLFSFPLVAPTQICNERTVRSAESPHQLSTSNSAT